MTPVIKMPIASHGFPNRSGDLELAEPGSLWFLEENGEVHSSSILWKYETCQHEGFLKPCLHMFAYVCIPNSHDPKMGPTLQVLVSSGLENEVSTQGAALGAMDMMEKLIFQKRHNCQANQTDVIHPPRCTSSDPSEMRSKGCENRPSSKDSFGTLPLYKPVPGRRFLRAKPWRFVGGLPQISRVAVPKSKFDSRFVLFYRKIFSWVSTPVHSGTLVSYKRSYWWVYSLDLGCKSTPSISLCILTSL